MDDTGRPDGPTVQERAEWGQMSYTLADLEMAYLVGWAAGIEHGVDTVLRASAGIPSTRAIADIIRKVHNPLHAWLRSRNATG